MPGPSSRRPRNLPGPLNKGRTGSEAGRLAMTAPSPQVALRTTPRRGPEPSGTRCRGGAGGGRSGAGRGSLCVRCSPSSGPCFGQKARRGGPAGVGAGRGSLCVRCSPSSGPSFGQKARRGGDWRPGAGRRAVRECGLQPSRPDASLDRGCLARDAHQTRRSSSSCERRSRVYRASSSRATAMAGPSRFGSLCLLLRTEGFFSPISYY
jgi:hypothetical protein